MAQFRPNMAQLPLGGRSAMKIVLLFPPATDVRGPHLAIPSLVAFLRANGVATMVRDLNLDGLFWLLDSDRLETAVRECGRSPAEGALEHADFVLEHVPRAIADLRDPVAFYDPHRHQLARATLLAACQLISTAHGRVRYSFSGAEYRVGDIDPARLADLAAVTADPRLNLFDALYRESVLPWLRGEQPDVVGISILNAQQIVPGLTLARLLKANGQFVVVGGTVYAKFVAELMRRPAFFELFCDAVVPYEGETALLALLEQLTGRRNLAAVPNLMFLDRYGQPAMGPTKVENVAALPTPDFTGLPLDRYLAPSPVLPILLGKGCYFNRCKFCDIPFINSIAERPYRVRPPDRVAEDVATLEARHGARCFELTDETLSPRSLLQFGEALAERGVNARFVGYARFERGFTPQACARIYEMGMRKIFFGLESGDQATLNHMRKGIRVDTARRVLRSCADAGIACHVFSIIGFPEEAESSARETLRFLLSEAGSLAHPRNSFDVHPFGLDLRTEYGEEPGRYGVEIDQARLAELDFPISVTHWRNVRGLSKERVEQLLAEFAELLRQRFRDYRHYPANLWPGFEEYAVLYARHYEDQPFPYRLSLPPRGEPGSVRLVWSPDTQVRTGTACSVSTLAGRVTVGAAALAVLAAPPPAGRVDDLLSALAERFETGPGQDPDLLAELRVVVDRLLAVRALRLVPAANLS
jgi:anaerobic magnesium-protoporphyrin IX monomethyl ester cyclase